MEYFSKNIYFLRNLKELTQSEIASQLGFKRTAWNNYESGVSTPVLKDALTIAKFLDVNLEDILTKDLRENTHLIEKYKDSKYWEKAHLKTHPSTHPIGQKEGKTTPTTKIETAFNQPLKGDKTVIKAIEVQLQELSSKMADIEASMSKRIAQIEVKISRISKAQPKK